VSSASITESWNSDYYRNLAKTISEFDDEGIFPFPAFDGSRFSQLLDEEMGFV